MKTMVKRIRLSMLVLIAATLLLTSFQVYAAFPLRVVVNNELISFPDAQPYIDKKDRTMVPVRFVSEALGAEVKWNDKEKKVTITQGKTKVVLKIGNKSLDVNGKVEQMDTVAIKSNERTFVPVRFVSQALGATIKWDEAVTTVYITTGGKEVKDPKGTEDVAGFTVPLDIDLLAVEESWGGDGEAMFQVNLLRANVKKQIEDLSSILLQKCDQSTVDAVVAHISKKKKRFDFLEHKYIFDERSKRYIYILESETEDINILYMVDGIKLVNT
ncbi:hypothetical protein I6N90_19890 [Paenibacillus sp. GSMTC-2017]|uniref:stalk domain-containing protein n=1 Tax=Paenibacillus sp. GSMTC-2017 TaxID=2794350 RepID=UPI0018D77272|nr:stalk domain-containing protein [Paenibacillus sp. GSMTC-2017]MBH5320068.1 hypothetical protein [Paenibacillus sp. GSMTC-2017]